MIQTAFNGNFGLIEIKKIHLRRTKKSKNLYDIKFVGDDRRLMTSDLHCFLTDDEQPKKTRDLKPGDVIWVDINELRQHLSWGPDNSHYYWSTKYYHPDNSFTMNDYLENHLPKGAEIILEDGSYCEIVLNNEKYALYAKGDGDCYNHVVIWGLLET